LLSPLNGLNEGAMCNINQLEISSHVDGHLIAMSHTGQVSSNGKELTHRIQQTDNNSS
jgi:hypothetical protein